MRRAVWQLLIVLLAPAAAAATSDGKPPRTVALFYDPQEAAPFSAEEMAERQKGADATDEGAAADLALNSWKTCVIESLSRWAPLKQGPGTLIDGAFGRCGDIERAYRAHLMKITQDGRQVVDVSMARGMTKVLEDSWRPRLTAMALDQELARLAPPPPSAPAKP